jgi:inosine-uridine nucleoside N-ribohydrolase
MVNMPVGGHDQDQGGGARPIRRGNRRSGSSPRAVEVIGLTTVFGNAAVEITTRNALVLLEIAGRGDIPVVSGAAAPIAASYLGPVSHVHGVDGMGDCGKLPSPVRPALEISAAEFLCRTIAEQPNSVTIVAIGPLTNLALALRLRPRIAGEVERVIVMGGNALVPGNATPAAEANVYNDPEAADVVFGAEWPVTSGARCDTQGQPHGSGHQPHHGPANLDESAHRSVFAALSRLLRAHERT